MGLFAKNYWKEILTFFLLATSLSLIFRIYHPIWLNRLKLPYGYGLNIMVGSGPLLAALISRKVFKHSYIPSLPLFGSSVVKSIIFLLAPILVLIICGIKNKQVDIHWLGLKTGFYWLLYIYGEEYGWRGYLQQLVKGNNYVKALIIGLLWYFWHLSFIFDQYNLLKELVFIVVLIAGSFMALMITRITQSLLTAIGLHFSFSVMTNIPFTASYKYGIMAMIGVWILLIFTWQKSIILKQ